MNPPIAFVEAATVDDLARHEAQWRDLASRAAEPNPFAEAAFLIPALRLAGPRRLANLLVWRDALKRELVGIVSLRLPPLGQGLARVWRSEQAGLAGMTFDHDRIGQALAAILGWLRARGVAGLILPAIEPSGALANAVRAFAPRFEAMNPRRRAALELGRVPSFEAGLDRKRRKEWARQGRRLADRGRLEARLVAGVEGIERFLALEAKGWKGARGTALAADSGRLAFAREMLGAFAARGQLQIHELALDGASIAIGVVLCSGSRAFYWKTAYDEAFGEFSPGVQMTLALSRRLEREPGLALVDSCALQDHPMIDRIWPARIELVDFAISCRPGRGWRFAAWLTAEREGARLRERVKEIVNRLRGRKRS